MVEVFGKNYYIDLDAITDRCKLVLKTKVTSEKTTDSEEEPEFDDDETTDIFKYEIIKMCLTRVLDDFEEVDEEMGVFGQTKLGISFKIAFNTLIKNQILIEQEDE